MWDIMLRHPSDHMVLVQGGWVRPLQITRVCRVYSEGERDADLKRFGNNPYESVWAVEVEGK